MKRLFSSAALAALIYRWRLSLSVVIVLGAIGFAPTVDPTRIDNDITAWFSKSDPVYRDYERFREEFGGSRSLIVAIRADSPERLFARETLQFIEQVTADIERVDTVHRVDSLATATIVESLPGGNEGGLDVRPLIENSATQPPEQVRRRAMRDDLLRGDLVNERGDTTAIVVSFDEERIDKVRAGVIQRVHEIVDPKLPAGVRAYYNGSLEISETYNRVTLDNQRVFTPPIFLFTVLAIYAAFRSLKKTLLALFAILVSVLWTLGLYSLMGFSYNVLTSMLIPLVAVLAVADDVHIMQHWDTARRAASSEEAFKKTVAHLATPLFGASATTALGMLSLATSHVVAVRTFGIGSAIGIMVDFVISLVLVPTLLTFVKPSTETPPNEKYLLAPLVRVARFTCSHPARVLAVSVVVGLVAALGILRLKVDTNHINFFAESHPLSESAHIIDTELSGVYSFQLMLEGPPDSLNTPDALHRLDRLQQQLRAMPHVRKVTSIADYVKRINKELNDGREEANVIPNDAATIAQELFVFTLGGEGRHELERVVASDFSRAMINVKTASIDSSVVLRHVEEADRLAKAAFSGTGISVMTTGSGRLFGTLDHYLVQSQMSSFATAFVTVFAVIFVVFRSFRFGLLTIVPNVLPVIAVLGVMGYLDISMNIATVMVASVALGVVDDDTIHFINRYRREIAAGASTDGAIELATAHEGRASLTTAIVNSAGYGVLFLSEYRPTAWFGGLLALTMAVAFLAEILILPAMIKLMPRVYGATALRRTAVGVAVAAIVMGFTATNAHAQSISRPTGYLSLFASHFPTRDASELRARAFAEQKLAASDQIRFVFSGFAEGLAGREETAIARAHEAVVDIKAGRLDLYAGYGRVVWGRLDELQPTDVVNPLDLSRFFFEGRSEARLPVAVVRPRVHISDALSLEAVFVPFFRPGRFDRLGESTSPFNIIPPGLTAAATGTDSRPDGPSARWANTQGGARMDATTGRLDWSISAYRGFESFEIYELTPAGLRASFPRFTMLGGDFESVSGQWGVRGEVAAFVRDSFQQESTSAPGRLRGNSVDAGLGVDRRAGDYRLSATVLLHRAEYDDLGTSETDVSVLVSTDRTFARERYQLRGFTVYNPSEGSGFVRAIATAKLRDDVAAEGSAGWFAGEGRDTIGRFSASDFFYLRLKYYF